MYTRARRNTNTKAGTGRSHVVHRGNQRVVLATREAVGAMKYKAQT